MDGQIGQPIARRMTTVSSHVMDGQQFGHPPNVMRRLIAGKREKLHNRDLFIGILFPIKENPGKAFISFPVLLAFISSVQSRWPNEHSILPPLLLGRRSPTEFG